MRTSFSKSYGSNSLCVTPKNHLTPSNEYGLRISRNSTLKAIRKKLLIDNARINNYPLSNMPKNFKGRYEHIIIVLTNIICLQLEILLGPLQVLKNLLHNQKHHTKLAMGPVLNRTRVHS